MAKRVDAASRVIKATPQDIYQAFIDPEALMAWLPPQGMKGRLFEFEARDGGAYRMALTYINAAHANPGKSSESTDVVQGMSESLSNLASFTETGKRR